MYIYIHILSIVSRYVESQGTHFRGYETKVTDSYCTLGSGRTRFSSHCSQGPGKTRKIAKILKLPKADRDFFWESTHHWLVVSNIFYFP